MPHPAFLSALEADRAELNQRFKLCSLQGTPLDAQAFQEHLSSRVEPIVAAVAERFPERTRLATRELFQVSLELFRAGYWNTESRLPELSRLWQDVLPKLATHIAREPERVSGSLSNALVNLANHPVRLDQWLNELAAMGALCESVSQLLEVNGIVAWRAGMALLRTSSLKSLQRLPESLAIATLQCSHAAVVGSRWQAMLERLANDRWYDPSHAADGSEPRAVIREHARVADYRGLGGSLMDLPTVFLHAGQLHVTDRTHTYRIEADCFGCILQATQDIQGIVPAGKLANLRTDPSIDAEGHVTWNQGRATLNYLADASSQACDGQTLAVTLPTSFHVYLLSASNM